MYSGLCCHQYLNCNWLGNQGKAMYNFYVLLPLPLELYSEGVSPSCDCGYHLTVIPSGIMDLVQRVIYFFSLVIFLLSLV